MNTSLPAVQISSESAGAVPGAAVNLPGKQQDSAFPGGFGPLLDQANTALVTGTDGSVTLPEDAQNLAMQLQSLPQGGKLLPLLQQVLDSSTANGAGRQQVLDSSTANGADRQQVLDHIAARLEPMLAGSEVEPAAAMTAVLKQMLEPAPEQALAPPPPPPPAVLTVETISLARAQGGPAKAPTVSGETPPALRVTQPSIDPSATSDRPVPADSPTESKNTPFDKSLVQFQQQAPELRQSQSELSMLVAAFKRQLDNPARPADALPRAEALGASVSVPVISSTPAAAVPPTGLPTLGVTTPLNQAGWDQALGERIQWLASQNIQSARITLNPANLGPMEVRIQVQNDQASVQFTSAHGVVREALEAALPRLRDMFEASGVELVDVDVAGQSFAEQQHGPGEEDHVARTGTGNGHDAGEDSGLELLPETPLASFLSPGRLDLFV